MTATLPRTSRQSPVSLLQGTGVAGALAAVAAVVLDWRLLVPVGLGLPLVALTLLGGPTWGAGDAGLLGRSAGTRSIRVPPSRADSAPTSILHGDACLAGVWTALLLTTTLQLLQGARSVEAAASGSLSLDNMLELASIMVAATVVATVFLDGWTLPVPRVAWLFVMHAVWASCSVLWSALPLFSLVRAFEVMVLAAFTAYCAARAAADPAFLQRLLPRVFRYLTFTALLLGVYGVVDGGLGLERFTWKGSHPNSAATILVVPCLALVVGPDRRRITHPLPWWLPPLVLLPLLYATGSRGTVGAALAALAVALGVMTLRDSRIGTFGLGIGLVVGGIAATVAGERISAYMLRGQDTDTILGLNGRRELWSWALDNPLGSEIWGVGIGAGRGVVQAVRWNPTNFHSAWVDTLQTLGVVGLALLGATVVSVLLLAVVRRSANAAWAGVFVTISSVNSITIAQPGYMLVLLCLAIVMVASRRTPDRALGAP